MKTAVSIPDALFERADRLAARLGKSRSEVYREALAEYVARRDRSEVTAALDAVADDVGAPADPWSESVARAALERSEW